MIENRKAAIKKLKKLIISTKGGVENFRANLEEAFTAVFLPNNVERNEHTYNNIVCDVLVPEIASVNKVLIYIHGGCFVGGSRASYRTFCASLANECSCRIVLPEFRIAPTYAFPASLDDSLAVFSAIHRELEIAKDYGTDSKIILAADGSGASIACGLLLKMSEEERRDVGSLVLFSPFLDLSSSSPSENSRKIRDEILSKDNLHRAADMYTYSSNFSNSLVSPLKASDEELKSFPPVFIQIGGKEILLEQAVAFKNLLEGAGGQCTLDVWPDMMFMFQMADEFLNDSHCALERVGNFLKNRESGIDEKEAEERDKILRMNNIKD